MMTKQEDQKEDLTLEQSKEQNLQLQNQVKILSDLKNLEDQGFYRMQTLGMMERIAVGLENLSLSLKEEEPKEEPKK